MKTATYRRSLTALLLGVLCWMIVGVSPAHAAQGPVLSQSDSTLEDDYYAHSMRRNQIADRLSHLWHSEKMLKAQYECTGRSDEIRNLNQIARELLSVRVEIDSLRGQLSQENQIINNIGESIPD